MTFPNRAKMTSALSKLKFMVVMDPLQTETARFWENHGEYNDVDPKSIQTEVFELPTTCFAEDEGSLSNSSRWLQWHWPAQPPPGEARTDIDIMAALYGRMKRLYEQEGGAFPDPILNLNWPYALADAPTPDELAKEINGYSLETITDPTDPTKVLLPAGKQLEGFAQLRDDGKTACGCWVYSGCYPERGNQMARRDNSDPGDRGIAPNWAWSWPANRRVLYNRASCDPQGKPWSEKKKIIEWNGKQWIGFDVPDYGPTVAPSQGVGPFIMNQEGVSRLFVRSLMRDGPFPAHYEPFESPIKNVLAPDIQGNPASRIFKDDLADSRYFGQVSVCRDQLSADGALPFLDQARAHQLDPAAGIFCRNLGAARGRERNLSWKLGAGVEQSRPVEGQGDGHKAHQAADVRRQDRACGWDSPTTLVSPA